MATKGFFSNLRLTVSRNVRDDTLPGAHKYRREETHDFYRVDLEVDVDDIMLELGTKAAHSKSRKSRAMGGAIRVFISKL